MPDDPFPPAGLTTEQALQDLIAGQRELFGLMVARTDHLLTAMREELVAAIEVGVGTPADTSGTGRGRL